MDLEMHEVLECVLCGSDVMPDLERTYLLEEHEALCFDCAVRSGGVYDVVRGTWTALPTLASLPWRAQPSSAEHPRHYRVCPHHGPTTS